MVAGIVAGAAVRTGAQLAGGAVHAGVEGVDRFGSALENHTRMSPNHARFVAVSAGALVVASVAGGIGLNVLGGAQAANYNLHHIFTTESGTTVTNGTHVVERTYPVGSFHFVGFTDDAKNTIVTETVEHNIGSLTYESDWFSAAVSMKVDAEFCTTPVDATAEVTIDDATGKTVGVDVHIPEEAMGICLTPNEASKNSVNWKSNSTRLGDAWGALWGSNTGGDSQAIPDKELDARAQLRIKLATLQTEVTTGAVCAPNVWKNQDVRDMARDSIRQLIVWANGSSLDPANVNVYFANESPTNPDDPTLTLPLSNNYDQQYQDVKAQFEDFTKVQIFDANMSDEQRQKLLDQNVDPTNLPQSVCDPNVTAPDLSEAQK